MQTTSSTPKANATSDAASVQSASLGKAVLKYLSTSEPQSKQKFGPEGFNNAAHEYLMSGDKRPGFEFAMEAFQIPGLGQLEIDEADVRLEKLDLDIQNEQKLIAARMILEAQKGKGIKSVSKAFAELEAAKQDLDVRTDAYNKKLASLTDGLKANRDAYAITLKNCKDAITYQGVVKLNEANNQALNDAATNEDLKNEWKLMKAARRAVCKAEVCLRMAWWISAVGGNFVARDVLATTTKGDFMRRFDQNGKKPRATRAVRTPDKSRKAGTTQNGAVTSTAHTPAPTPGDSTTTSDGSPTAGSPPAGSPLATAEAVAAAKAVATAMAKAMVDKAMAEAAAEKAAAEKAPPAMAEAEKAPPAMAEAEAVKPTAVKPTAVKPTAEKPTGETKETGRRSRKRIVSRTDGAATKRTRFSSS